jgi:hypothetical protein
MSLSKPSSKNLVSVAERLMQEMQSPKPASKTSTFVAPKNGPAGPDISKIQLPDSLVESILEFSGKKPKVEAVVEEVESVNEEQVIENKVTDLILKLNTLLKEARAVVQEMTTAGMIGTNQKFVLNKKKKNGPTKATKGN